MKRILLAIFLCCSASSNADMNPLHEPGKRFTLVLGVDLMKDGLVQVHRKLGKSPSSAHGDASRYVAKTCYLLGDGATTVEFNEWELGAGCVVRKRTKDDSAACTPVRRQNADNHGEIEIGGLKLGMSQGDVLKLLGEPTKRTPKKWTYDFHGKANDDSGAARFGKGQEYFWQLLIRVSFEDSAVSRIEVNPSVQS